MVSSAFGQDGSRRILVGDRLELLCEDDPALSVVVTVAENGSVAIPGIGWVSVLGRNVSQAEEAIRQSLSSRYALPPRLEVRRAVAERAPVRFRGALERVGEVALQPGMRLSDLMSFAGPLESADSERVVVETSTGEVFVWDALGPAGGRLLRPGDRIFVPQADLPNEVTVLGGVQKPGVFPFRRGMNLQDAVRLAGGLSEEADPSTVEIERRRVIAQTVNLGTGGNADLQRGDVIRVKRAEPRGFVVVAGWVEATAPLPVRFSLSLGEAVRRARPRAEARTERVLLIRRIQNREQRTFHDVSAIWEGKIADVPLLPGDRIEIERRPPARVRPATEPPGVRR